MKILAILALTLSTSAMSCQEFLPDPLPPPECANPGGCADDNQTPTPPTPPDVCAPGVTQP